MPLGYREQRLHQLPIAAEHLHRLVEEWLRFVHPLAGRLAKALVVDLDNTLWGGVIGDDGVDKLQIGQKTLLRLSAFNQRTTPELNGVVTRLSPDVTTDQRTGQSYYTIRVSMPPEEIARLGDVKLIPGMPVEAFVQTGDRTMFSYLMKPFSDQLMRSFKER